jgi:hypothetical protein
MPITLNGDTGIQTPMYNGTITANAVTPSVNMKNRIINGAMTIDQRNNGASVTISNSSKDYTLDRWSAFETTDGVITVQQVSDAPTGFINSSKITTTTADGTLAADQRCQFTQDIEGLNVADLGWGTANAKTVTLSFWVKSSLTGTFGGSLANSAANRSYVFTYSISAANTWEQKSVTIAGDTSGTWLTTNGIGIRLYFGLGVGTDFQGTAGSWSGSFGIATSGSVSVIGTLNATWFVTGVQLEVGSTATSFDYRPYGTELNLCMRYFFLSDSTAAYAYFGSGYQAVGYLASNYFYYPVPMRTTATITKFGAWSLVNCTGPDTLADKKGYIFYVTLSGTGAYTVRNAESAYLTFNAEL